MQTRKARPINYLIGVIFALAGGAEMFAHEYLSGAIYATLSLSFVVYGNSTSPWGQLPLWRQWLSGLLVGAAAGLVVVQVVPTFAR